jgi:predicted negative regulator of RcsB-dependent stress response
MTHKETPTVTATEFEKEPPKFWGDALAVLGKKKEALAKYDEALTYAPKWEQPSSSRATLVKQND